MRVLVSGAHGLIGSALVEKLTADGHDVAPIRRQGHELDLSGLEGADAVVHLAGAGLGEQRWTAERKRVILASRVEPTRQLAEALAGSERRPGVLVSGSAVGWYGDRGDEVLTEESGPGTGFLADVCRQWEAATAPAADAGVRVVHLRSGIVLAAGGGALQPLLLPFKLGLGGRIGSGRQWFSWVAIDDELGAIVHALTEDAVRGPLNATAPHPVTYGDFARALGAALHRPAILPTPLPALWAKLGREGTTEMVLSGQRVMPARLQATGYRFAHPELDAALAAVLSPPLP